MAIWACLETRVFALGGNVPEIVDEVVEELLREDFPIGSCLVAFELAVQFTGAESVRAFVEALDAKDDVSAYELRGASSGRVFEVPRLPVLA